MNNKDLFSNKAEYYDSFRPSYAEAFIQEMIARKVIGEGMTVADIGAGTGILTCQLAGIGADVIAVEPNEQMIEKAILNTREMGVKVIKGSAEDIPIEDRSVDSVFVGQAFHWFNPVLFKKECRRILKRNGTVVLVWNRKSAGEMESERKRIVNSYEHAVDSFHCSWDERLEGISDFFSGKFEMMSFPNDLVETEDVFIGRTLSASHALGVSSPLIDGYISQWHDFFQRFQENGLITTKNETVAFIGHMGKSSKKLVKKEECSNKEGHSCEQPSGAEAPAGDVGAAPVRDRLSHGSN